MRNLEFLGNPSEARLRKEIQNIADSYSHPWDQLAELCQNSVDAIRSHMQLYGSIGQPSHRIKIIVNATNRSISIEDTGVGIPVTAAATLFAPHGTDKDGKPELIGEKGVGLTFTIFSSNSYLIETTCKESRFIGEIKCACDWKNKVVTDPPVLQILEEETGDFDPKVLGTKINLRHVEPSADPNEDIFAMNLAQLSYVLRTKTAIGDTTALFSEVGLNIIVELTVTSANNITEERTLPFKYLTPEEAIPADKVISLDDFLSKAAYLDDAHKAKNLTGKAIRVQGSVERSGRTIKYYALFAPSRRLWREVSQRLGAEYFTEDPDSKAMVEGGIYTATKRMPTGISLEPPQGGSSGYWPNLYILLEDDSITFDVGRKAIPGRTQGLLKAIAKERIFEKIRPIIRYTGVDPETRSPSVNALQQAQKAAEFARLRNLPELEISKIGFSKHPERQEAAVVAIFHELVGAKLLQGYYSLASGHKSTYDLWCKYSAGKDILGANFHGLVDSTSGRLALDAIVEFKYKLESIVADWKEDVKYFSDIDLIICWDFDEVALKKHFIEIRPIDPENIIYDGSNYSLEWAPSYNLGQAGTKPVIALRALLDNLRRSSG